MLAARYPRRGEVWWGDPFKADGGSRQSGMRPWVVVSNDLFNRNSPCVTAVPCTSKGSHPWLPVHAEFLLNGKPNVARCEQISTFENRCLTTFVGRVDGETMQRILRAIAVQLEMDPEGEGAG